MESCLEAGPRKGKTGRSFSDVTVRLAVSPVASAVPCTVFQAAADTFFAFPRGSIDRSAIPGKGKIKKVNQSIIYRPVKEKDFKNVIKPFTGSHVIRWLEFKLFKEVLNGNFLHRGSFFTFLLRLLRLFFWRVDGIGKVVLIREPETAKEIIESTDARGITDRKARKDGMEMVLFEIGSPFCVGNDLKLYG